jgi:hypothetical protein
VRSSQAAEQETRTAALHLETNALDDGSLDSPQNLGNSNQMLCFARRCWGVVGHRMFGEAERPFRYRGMIEYVRMTIDGH